MIDIERLASGLADNLLHASESPTDAKSLIEDAFRRGLHLGLSVRPRNAFRSSSKQSREPKDAEPWTTMH